MSFCVFILYYAETERTTDDVETKHLFFCLFSRLIRKKADQSGATKEKIRSDRVKDDKVCLSVNFLTLFNEHYNSDHASFCLKKTLDKFHFTSYLEETFFCCYGE